MLKRVARVGYASRGVVYLLVGAMAVLAAIGRGGEAKGARGVLEATLTATGGWLLVAPIAVGLVGYSVWRFCQSVLDADSHGTNRKGLLIRGGLFVSCVTHLLLALWAGYSVARLVARSESGGGSGDWAKQELTAWLMAQPFGRWLVAFVGVAFAGAGVAHIIKGYKDKFEKRFDWNDDLCRYLSPVCTFGLYARSIVYLIIGGFFVYAGWTHDPGEAAGLTEAMRWQRQQPFGAWLFAATAVGLMSFGAYSIITAIYRRINVPDVGE